jgi:ArsR family transcriptional regulator, arsenate/arsenite/antimonite-responsive transcriptional repressor
MDSLFKALSDKNRRKILDLLKSRSMNVGEIQKHFEITPASLSHHLDILKRAGLVVIERRGQFIHYSLNTSVFEEIAETLFKLFKVEHEN